MMEIADELVRLRKRAEELTDRLLTMEHLVETLLTHLRVSRVEMRAFEKRIEKLRIEYEVPLATLGTQTVMPPYRGKTT